MSDFRCPRCGGPHFGTSSLTFYRDGVEVPFGSQREGDQVTQVVECHNTVDGGAPGRWQRVDGLMTFVGSPAAMCGWRGKWPVEANAASGGRGSDPEA